MLPEFVLLKPKTAITYYEIEITNNGNDITNETISIPILDTTPLAEYVAAHDVDYTDFVAFDPDAGSYLPTWVSGFKNANKAFNYVRFYTKTSIPSGGTKRLWLVLNKDQATIYRLPQDLFDVFITDSYNQYDYIQNTDKISDDYNNYLSPPSSVNMIGQNSASQPITMGKKQFTVCNYMYIVVNFYSGQYGGHPFAGRTGDDSNWAGPYTWVGSSSPWVGAGTNIGYYDTNYHVLGQFVSNKWNELLLFVRMPENNYKFILNNNLLKDNTPFIQKYGTWSSGSGAMFWNDVVYESVNYDDVLIYCVNAEHNLQFSYGDQVKELQDIIELGVTVPLDRY